MTPQAFFDKLISERSKFVLAKLIKDLSEQHDVEALQYFVEDVEKFAKEWQERKRDEAFEEDERAYNSEIDFLTGYFVRWELPQEAYERRMAEIKPPLPPFLYPLPPLPDEALWALERLRECIKSTVTVGGLPDELNTDRARKYFARAVEVGYMQLTPTGAIWLFGGNRGKARLAYFLEKVFCPEPTDKLQTSQCKELDRFFNVDRLDRASQQNADTGKSQAVKKWRAEIDELFID